MFESEDEKTHRKKAGINNDSSSSSESDIESYLQRPEDLNLNSTFFQVEKKSPNKSIIHEKTKTTLSDSDSDDPLSFYINNDDKKEPVPSTSKTPKKVTYYDEQAFKAIADQANELEEAKKQVEAYLARRKAETENSEDVASLLAHGEKPYDLAEDLAEVGFHPSDFESDNESEKGDWEEVEETEEKNIIPKDGVQITVSMPNQVKKKKGIDLMAALKRRMNRIKKENQIYVHKVHLLCWIAHGNYLNNILNKENIMAMALSLLPTKDCYPPARTNLKYLEQITKWYHKAITYKQEPNPSYSNIEDVILKEIGDKVVKSANVFVYIFVSLLRALGMQCRVVLSLDVEPLRPPNSELFSVSNTNVKSDSAESNSKINDVKDVKKSAKGKEAAKNIHSVSKSRDKSSNNTADSKKLPIVQGGAKKQTATISKREKAKTETQGKEESPAKEKNANVELSKQRSRKCPGKKKIEETVIKKDAPKKTKIPKLDLPKYNSPSESQKCTKSPEIVARQTRSRTTKTVYDDDSDFKKPTISSTLKPKSDSKSTRSKSATNDSKTNDSLDLPTATSINKRSKSSSNVSLRKSKIVSSIDATVAALEALESTKPNLKKLSSASSASEDDEFLDRSIWRRSKSPQTPKPISQIDQKSPKGLTKETLLQSNPALLNSMFQSDDEKSKPKNKNKIKVRAPVKRKVPQLDGDADDSITGSSDDDEVVDNIQQADGNDDGPPNLSPLKTSTQRSVRLRQMPKLSPQKQKTPPTKAINLNSIKSIPKNPRALSQSSSSRTSSTSSYFTPDKADVKGVIVNLVKKSLREDKYKMRQKTVKKSYIEEDSDSDFAPKPITKKRKPTPDGKVKKRVLPRSQLEALAKNKAEAAKKKSKGIDIWVEVFLEEEEKWISADVVSGKVHCIKDIYNKASHPVSYILAWDNISKVKDVTKRYCPNWNTVTRKLRVDQEWWNASLKPFIGVKTARDKDEDEDLARQQLDQPLPKTISEYKDHPLYVLKRHLLKFQALYPPDPPVLGFVRTEEVYSRECVYVLHSRDIWLKHAKVVKPGEEPYKIVKARPKYDKLSNTVINDQLLEIFGVWQVEDYVPPTAENGMVPRNAYGNIELFKPCMLPKKCVHLQLPGLKKIAAKLNIDCAPALTGFDFHGGWNHAIYDGFVVCEEFKDVLIDAWEQEQEEITKREQEKYEKRVFGNWRRLIKAALISRRLKLRYNFSEKEGEMESDEIPSPEEEKVEEKVEAPSKPKRPKFMSRK